MWESGGPSLVELLKQHEQKGEAVQTADSNVEPVADLPVFWRQLIEEVGKTGPGLPSLLSHGRPVELTTQRLVIRYSQQHETLPRMLDRNGKKDALRQTASALAGRPLEIVFEVDATGAATAPGESVAPAPAAPARRHAPAPPPPREPDLPIVPVQRVTPELVESIRANQPLVKALMDNLNAQVIKVE